MRAAIFIDGGYFLQQLKVSHITPDYRKLADFLLEPIRQNISIDLLRCYFYYCAPWMSPNPTEDEQRRMAAHNSFVEEIERLNRWQVRLGKLEKRWDGQKEYFEQKRVDVLLSVDMVRHSAAGHIQHAVLVAGDSDFIPAVASAKESGVTLSLWCGNFGTVHKDLTTLSDEVHQFQWRNFPRVESSAQKISETPRVENASATSGRSTNTRAKSESVKTEKPSKPMPAPRSRGAGGGRPTETAQIVQKAGTQPTSGPSHRGRRGGSGNNTGPQKR